MIQLALLLLVGKLVVTYWDELVKWIKDTAKKLKKLYGIVVEGVKTFLVRVRGGFEERAKHYSQNKSGSEFKETTVIRSVTESEIPPDILEKMRHTRLNKEVETTEELSLALSA